MAPNQKKSPSSASAKNVNRGGGKTYTWQEVAKHNTEESCWVYTGNTVYDITSWLPKHPGGKPMLMLAAGRDITDMMPSYHPFTDKPDKILAQYAIGELEEPEFPQYKPDSGFFKEIRSRVGQHFAETGKDYKDPRTGATYLFFFLVIAFFSFRYAYNTANPWAGRLLAAVIFGVFQALPLLHTMHDASHTSIGHTQAWWSGAGRLAMDWFAGASLTSWHNQHVIGHHVYTNVMGVDPDLPVVKKGDLRRVDDWQETNIRYRFQHLYLLVLYGLLAFKFRIQDIQGIVSGQNGKIRLNLIDWSEYWYQAIVKSVFLFMRIYVPLYYLGVSGKELAILFAVSDYVTGVFLAFNFQVSHVSPTTEFPNIDGKGFEKEWAVSQVLTTVDYAHGNRIMAFLCGHLNYQTIHHLFPAVSQYHYPAIAPIVMQVCKEYNIPFTHLPTFKDAFLAHVKHLQTMGMAEALKEHHH